MRWVGGLSALTLLVASGCSATPLSAARSGSGEIGVTLIRTADQSGNIVGAENYYQHAEHYFRSMSANQDND